jgi:hypothetical protein
MMAGPDAYDRIDTRRQRLAVPCDIGKWNRAVLVIEKLRPPTESAINIRCCRATQLTSPSAK